MTDSNTGAIDNDWDENEKSYERRVADALEGVQTEPMAGGIAVDLVTRQMVMVRRKVADSLGEYYEREGFDLATYKMHPFLPVRTDDAVYEVAYAEPNPQNAHKTGRTYDMPRGRLMHLPVELAWTDGSVGSL